VSGPNRIDIDEQLKQEAIIFRNGVNTDFWDATKKLLLQLKEAAKDTLVIIDPSDVSTISQCQATAKVVDQLINAVEDTARLI